MARCSREGCRIILWMCWVTQWLLSGIYVALAFITFTRLWNAATEASFDINDLAKNRIWRGPLASLVLSALLVIGFTLMSCVTLIKRTINRAGAGFGYGFIVAFCFSLAFFLLLTGLVLDGFRTVVADQLENKAQSWTNYSTETYMGTEVFALLNFCTLFIFGFVLLVLSPAMADHLGIDHSGDAAYAPAGLASAAMDGKDAPAAPPEYEQFEQYGNYGQFDANAGQGGQASAQGYYVAPTATAAQAAQGYYNATDYQTTEYNPATEYQQFDTPTAHQPSGAMPSYANTGYAAVNVFSTTTAAEPAANAGLKGQQI